MERARSGNPRRRLAGLLCLLALALLATGCHKRAKSYSLPEVRRAFAKAGLQLETVATDRREIARLLPNSCSLDDADAAKQAIAHMQAILRARPVKDSIGGKVVMSAYLFDTATNTKRITGVGYFEDDGCLYDRPSTNNFLEWKDEGNLLLVGVSGNNNGSTGKAFRGLSAALGGFGMR